MQSMFTFLMITTTHISTDKTTIFDVILSLQTAIVTSPTTNILS